MKSYTLKLIAVLCLAPLLPGTISLQAALEEKQPNMENALHDLQEAKTAAEPIPLLEKAKKSLKESKHNKRGYRLDADAPIDKAIEEAKAGHKDKMVEQIDAAIAEVHTAMSKSH